MSCIYKIEVVASLIRQITLAKRMVMVTHIRDRVYVLKDSWKKFLMTEFSLQVNFSKARVRNI